jgi:26S proteasome regulatory subunit N11
MSFEKLAPRAVAIVVDPIQSVKGKVVIDAFRSINLMQALSFGELSLSFLIHSFLAWGRKLAPTSEPRQTTSNLGKHKVLIIEFYQF